MFHTHDSTIRGVLYTLQKVGGMMGGLMLDLNVPLSWCPVGNSMRERKGAQNGFLILDSCLFCHIHLVERWWPNGSHGGFPTLNSHLWWPHHESSTI